MKVSFRVLEKPRKGMVTLAFLAVCSAPVVLSYLTTDTSFSFINVAQAADDGDGGSGSGKGPNPDRGGGHGGGGGSGGSGSVPGGIGSGQGGPGDDSDAKGPRYGGGEGAHKPSGDQGGRPVWAQEGIPEIELGRLNVVRSPSHVIDRSVAEAISNFQPAMAAFYNMTAEDAANLLATSYDTVVRIDSPLENLGLYRDLFLKGSTGLPGVSGATTLDLAAILLGSASDKTLAVTTDTVNAINTILGITMSEADVATLADKAEAIRSAILTGHGE
jgi:hypothetical protein